MSSAPWLFIEATSPCVGQSVEISSIDVDHLVKVLRLKNGQKVVAVDPVSQQAFSAVLRSKKSNVQVELIHKLELPIQKPAVRTLYFALLKGKKNDFVCEKATELGVQRIIPWQSERSILRIKTDREKISKEKKFQALVRGAAAQCRRVSLPEVQVYRSLAELLDREQIKETTMFCSLDEGADSIANIVGSASQPIGIFVGPEGDFSPSEYATLNGAGVKAATLGSLTLRAETASLVAIASVWAIQSMAEEKKR